MCAVPAVKTRHIYGKVKAERAFYILFSTILIKRMVCIYAVLVLQRVIFKPIPSHMGSGLSMRSIKLGILKMHDRQIFTAYRK